ncbi:MAG: heavy-metal-associated domain-containing protein [Candidatus Acidiferrales bacterium]
MHTKEALVVLIVFVTLALGSTLAANEARAEFKVTGMSCGACAKGVEARVADLKGVKSATVSYEESSATVVYDDETVTAEEIKKTIEKSGFKAEPKSEKKK